MATGSAVMEILISNSRTREYIEMGEREGRSITDAMIDGAIDGMQTFDTELEKMLRAGIITREVALAYASNANNLALMINDLSGSPAPMPTEPIPPPRPPSDVPKIDGFER